MTYTLTPLLQAQNSPPLSALMLYGSAVGSEGAGVAGGASEVGGLFLHVGLQSGVLVRTEVDKVTGKRELCTSVGRRRGSHR